MEFNIESAENLDKNRGLTYEFRCPQCLKLFSVHRTHVKTHKPEFQCNVCQTCFSFDCPPKDPFFIQTKTLTYPQISKETAVEAKKKDQSHLFKKCPQCGEEQVRATVECIKCQVIFAKIESMPADAREQRAFPSLIKAWKDLMRDYGSLQNHLAFVDRCEDLQALPFALKKYKALREAQPQDEVANDMIKRLILRKVKLPASLSKWAIPLTEIQRRRLIRISPVIFSLSLILVGLSKYSLRNFVGVGASVLFMTLGFYFLSRGRISYRDFWE